MNKTKVIIGVGVAGVVLAAAFLTVVNSIVKKNPMGENSRYDASISMSQPMLPGIMGDTGAAEKSVPANGRPQSQSMIPAPDVQDKKVIKNGSLTLKVNNVDKSAEEIGQSAKNNGGDVFSSNFFKNSNDLKSGTIIVKVPVANFEKTFSDIKKVAAVVVRESTSGQDVTEEYQDIESRIKNKQAEEAAYKKILESAQKIEDILAVTQALSEVRGEIESLQGRLKYLTSQTDMATIAVNISEDSNITISDSWRPIQVVKEALNSLIKKSQGFINFLIILIITIIPVALLYLLLLGVIYKIAKTIYLRFKKKKETEKTGQV